MQVPFRRLLLLPMLAALACGGPLPFLSGGSLEGEVKSVPSDWTAAGDYGTAQLETRPEDPYSVNLAYTLLDGALYLNAGNTETQWVQNMTADPQVRLRLKGAIYELHADRVTDPAEIDRFGQAWTSQSMFRRDPTQLDEVWIYRLRAR